MLSMDDIKYIKRLHEKEGLSIREIMRRTGYHYETVTKYLYMEVLLTIFLLACSNPDFLYQLFSVHFQ